MTVIPPFDFSCDIFVWGNILLIFVRVFVTCDTFVFVARGSDAKRKRHTFV